MIADQITDRFMTDLPFWGTLAKWRITCVLKPEAGEGHTVEFNAVGRDTGASSCAG
jgi:hypothetical protein